MCLRFDFRLTHLEVPQPISGDADDAAHQHRLPVRLRPRVDRGTASFRQLQHHASGRAASSAAPSHVYGTDCSMSATRASDCQQSTRRIDERRSYSGEPPNSSFRHPPGREDRDERRGATDSRRSDDV